ncbi:MAG: hypothetical protein UV19_C0002G0016 [Parcubacteria group bacterium GW2011_GWA2_42_28]|nr:MAG: hypothetical protein UV19_C0002G0016 [Parcubacteria group bacterium GW2011_GWA2_42_28]KKT55884.1 MAG: hypothetical protein UW45_C0003G0017 [Parcubacteria group bacterium GW2011_GWC2_44_22]
MIKLIRRRDEFIGLFLPYGLKYSTGWYCLSRILASYKPIIIYQELILHLLRPIGFFVYPSTSAPREY